MHSYRVQISSPARGRASPDTPHWVTGKNDGRCRFVIVQGLGKYDFIKDGGGKISDMMNMKKGMAHSHN